MRNCLSLYHYMHDQRVDIIRCIQRFHGNFAGFCLQRLVVSNIPYRLIYVYWVRLDGTWQTIGVLSRRLAWMLLHTDAYQASVCTLKERLYWVDSLCAWYDNQLRACTPDQVSFHRDSGERE